MATGGLSPRADSRSNPVCEALILVDQALHIVQWDPEASRLLGWSKAEVLRHPLSLLLPDAELRRIQPDIEQALHTGARAALGRHADCRLLHKRGEAVSMALMIVPVHLSTGLRCGLILQPDGEAGADIRELRETLSRRQATLDAAQIGLVEWDLAHATLWKSRQGVALVTGDPDTPMRTFEQFLSFVLPEDHAVIQAAAERTVRDGTMQQVEYRVRWTNGEIHWLSTRGRAILDASGQYSRVFGVELDITRRKEAEEKANAANRRVETILDSISDAFFSLDGQWRFDYLNQHAEEMLGRKKEELLGRNVWEAFPDAAAVFREQYENARSAAQPARFEAYYPRYHAWYDVHAYPRPNGLSVFFSDITAQKRYEQSLKQLSRQLQTTREAERSRIAREIHDELGSALAVMKMDISSLLRNVDKLPGGQAVDHNDLPGQVDAMLRSIRRIIDDLRPSILDTLGLWAALEWLAHQFEERHGIHCSFLQLGEEQTVEPELATAIFRIVQEALTNVAKHARATEVEVDAVVSGRRVKISIRDNGCGFNPEQAARPDAHGLLGIRERAAYFGGRVEITANQPKGTALTIDMPLDNSIEQSP